MGQRIIKLMVSGGGTGGHLFPGIAVAEALLETRPDSKVLFVGTDRHTDKHVLAHRDFKRATVNCQGLMGKTLIEKIRSLIQLPLAVVASARLIREFKPDLVMGVGGYVTGPVLLAAKILRVPTCIHEQNSVPGMANRKLGSFVDRVFLSLPGSEKYFSEKKCVLTGNPVRKEIVAAAGKSKEPQTGLTLLVIGGSLGAHRVNTLILEAMAVLENPPPDFKVIHQTGAADEQFVRNGYEELGIMAEVSAFFENMADLYKKADIVVSRAGATSLAEMTVFGLPMILIPFPYAADDHQQKNGEYLVRGGAARMIREKELDGEQLAEEILNLMSDKKKRREMALAAAELARPNATMEILKECGKLIGKSIL
ncbi:MAG: undecaprenyldiphospho-muramoylpentapeptide beta-N-acetylglucosaminyltransferase [Desulfobulbaceae bacterium]|nr:undecaprenyldiphospho-muramoylpentapeptide beta-N-acetylglucosaminyltransferase [Desulfobulbaceae bacterium]